MFPSNKNYVLGRGELHFGRFGPGTRSVVGGMRYLGNSPSLSISADSESLDHYDADGPVRVKDDSVLIELNRTGNFTVDHVSPENQAMWLGGAASVVEQAALTAQAFTLENVRRGSSYQIGESASNPVGVRGVTTVTATAGATPLVENVDYLLDREAGLIQILPGSTVIDEDDTTDVSLEVTAPAVSYHQAVSGSDANIEGRLLFKATNAKGAKFDYLFPYVRISPDGEYELKGEEWQTMSFVFDALKLNDITESVYTSGRPGVYIDP